MFLLRISNQNNLFLNTEKFTIDIEWSFFEDKWMLDIEYCFTW